MNDDRSIPNVDDAKEYESLRESMTVVGINEQEQSNLFQLLSGLLRLGNIEFQSIPNVFIIYLLIKFIASNW